MVNAEAVMFCEEGSSNKEYRVQMEKAEDGFSVNYQFGRKGQALKSGSKTAAPVTFEQAKIIFDKLVKEKLGKGYVLSGQAGGQQYVKPAEDRPISQFLPQLLNAIEESELDFYLRSPGYALQQKLDGERRSIQLSRDGSIVGINRKGLAVDLPIQVDEYIKSAFSIFSPCILDGEMVGERFYVFDFFLYESTDFKTMVVMPFLQRMRHLLKVGTSVDVPLVVTAYSQDQKRVLFDKLRDLKQEGVVIKHVDSLYQPGKPNSGGEWLKFKFVESASCIVIGINQKRSVALGLFDETGALVNVGNVTVPANQALPQINQILECRYLYAYRNGSLFQPVMLGLRNDVDASACTTSQLKYKPDLIGADHGQERA